MKTATGQLQLPFESIPAGRDFGDSSRDIRAFNFFDAAYPSPENLQNWGHLQPETAEDITDPESVRKLRIASLCEVLNDDALNGMVRVYAESIVSTGCQTRVQCGFKHGKHDEQEQYLEYLWSEWFKEVQYAQKLRTAQKDHVIFGSYFRRIIYNPLKKFGMDVVLVSPLRIQTPYYLNEGDFVSIEGEQFRCFNGIAFDEYKNERYYCVTDRPPLQNGYYDNAVYEWVSGRVMCHVFDQQFSEQISGYPMTTPSLNKGVLRRQYELEELRAARLGASLTGTFETSSEFRAVFETLTKDERTLLSRRILKDFESAGESIPIGLDAFLNLPPLTQAKAFDTKHPHSGFASHRAESLKGQGRSLGMPENIATGSSANYNYASVQKDNQHWDNHRQIARQQVEVIDLLPAFQHFLALAAALDPMLSRNMVYPVIPTFYWKEEPHADPVKQANAWKILSDMRVLSLSDIMMQLGKDPEKQKLTVKSDLDDMDGYLLEQPGEPPESAYKSTGQEDE